MMQDQYTLNSNTANQFYEETLNQSQNSLNSNANSNQLLCEELKNLKLIIQRIQNISNTNNRIEIKKQAEFQMKENNLTFFYI
ncbi:hypothetical protein C1646_758967 [Rhizophagus diaphanus]|nr:hypothetical protein C1646_758967 [Rhizophagus diaphanus] [Rhizophagus sp. MUCL 43196]